MKVFIHLKEHPLEPRKRIYSHIHIWSVLRIEIIPRCTLWGGEGGRGVHLSVPLFICMIKSVADLRLGHYHPSVTTGRTYCSMVPSGSLLTYEGGGIWTVCLVHGLPTSYHLMLLLIGNTIAPFVWRWVSWLPSQNVSFSVTKEGRGEFTFVLKLLSRHLPE